MNIGLESLIVGLFALLPGFVSAGVRNILAPRVSQSPAGWAVGSIVTSLFLNAAILAGALLLHLAELDLSEPAEMLDEALKALPVRTVAVYLAALYVLALVWGIISGLLDEYAPQRLVYLTRLSPVSPETSVFTQAFSEIYRTKENLARRGSGEMMVPWLRIETEGGTVVGRLRFSSFVIDENCEVFLRPARYLHDSDAQAPGPTADLTRQGLYMRITKDRVVEVFSAKENWEPEGW